MGPTAVGVDSPFACIPTIQRHNLFRFFKVHDQDKSVNKKGQKARRSRQVVGGANTIASEDSAVCSEEFLLGTSISVYQNSGSPSPTNWGEFEKKKTFFGRPYVLDPCGESSNFWENFDRDIELAHGLGSNAFRMSLEWSRLMPEQGKMDETAVQRYHDILDALQRRGMEPIVVLHHFVHPQWFEDLGGFTNQDNIRYFVHYSCEVFRRFGHRMRMWATFNEPTVSTFCGYIGAIHPPGSFMRTGAAGRYLCNVLRAHTQTYKALKALPGGHDVAIGIIHQWMTWEPRRGMNPLLLRYLAKPSCKFLNEVWANPTVMRYFLTGEYFWKNRFGKDVVYEEPERPGLDFIGLNYYTRGVLDWKLQSTCHPGQIMTDMGFPIDPEGFYEAIRGVSVLGKPIYVTETGIADATDAHRPYFINSHVDQLKRALNDGFDVRSLFLWTLLDNFEWQNGYRIKFGLYEWSPANPERRPRPSVATLRHAFANLLPKPIHGKAIHN